MPDAAQLDALDAEHAVDRFQCDLPGTSRLSRSSWGPAMSQASPGCSATPDVGHGSVLLVGVSNKPELPLQLHLNGALLDFQKGIQEFKSSETEAGSIQGKAFVRVYWSGMNKGSAVRGFFYVARDGGQLIEIHGLMGESLYETTRPLLEASVLTFRKK